MVNMNVICPNCKSWMVYPVEALHFRNWYHRILGRILYRCEECNWVGYIVRKQGMPPILWIVIAIMIMSLIMVLIKVEL